MTSSTLTLAVPEEIITGTQDVFSTMLMQDISGTLLSESERKQIAPNMTSMIGLGGGIRGLLAIHCPAAAAKNITGALLGMEVEDLDDDVKDAVGEIANMVAGNLKISFAKIQVDIELAIPTSTIGENFRLAGLAGAHRHVVAFQLDDTPFWIELLYVRSE